MIDPVFTALLTPPAQEYEADIRYTNAAIHFMVILAYGSTTPLFDYTGYSYTFDTLQLLSVLQDALTHHSIQTTLSSVEQQDRILNALKQSYLQLLMMKKSAGFQEVLLKGSAVTTSNMELVKKLQQLGLLAEGTIDSTLLSNAVARLQKQHSLKVQRKLGPSALAVLNESIHHKVQVLAYNIRWYRWLSHLNKTDHLLVNIPANTLSLVLQGNKHFKCKVVVGKRSTPTPTLSSEIKNVIYYPYWNVPTSIAVNEMLPKLKRNASYLNRERLEVLQGGKIVPGVNWNLYSANNFPFQLRQRTGCKNSLGRLKFDFENPFSVYLHDTNAKGVFSYASRFLSHGCMRVEKPFELALAMGVPADKVDHKKCLENKKPENIPLPVSIPVLVVYTTIEMNNGELQWHEDFYRKIKQG